MPRPALPRPADRAQLALKVDEHQSAYMPMRAEVSAPMPPRKGKKPSQNEPIFLRRDRMAADPRAVDAASTP